MLIMSLGCLQFSRESCLLYAFLLGYLPSIFCDFGEKPIDFYLQDSFILSVASKCHRNLTRELFFCIFETAVCRFLCILGNQPNCSHLHSAWDTPSGT